MANPIRNALVASAIAAAGLGGAFSLAAKWEGNATKLYIDPVGKPTICRGTTTGPLIKKGVATAAECDEATLKDLEVAGATVRRCYIGPMTNGEYNAWASFTNNVGPGGRGVKDGFCSLKSGAVPSHLRLLREGKPRAACKMLFQWTNPPALKKGLLARRTDEYALCIHDLPPGAP